MSLLDSCFVGVVQRSPEPDEYVLLCAEGPRHFATLEQMRQFIVSLGLAAFPLPDEEGWGEDARDLDGWERQQLSRAMFGAV